jgi:hypothetical protein
MKVRVGFCIDCNPECPYYLDLVDTVYCRWAEEYRSVVKHVIEEGGVAL